ncbi:hypothetical protein DSAG12_01002 [Promethearchaeum syntrophicum]|uniref:DUF998 domain-containing protein n=1 Tax=Promethearchaeum syntrophicum TaxID=2594042 RepID=A0A5B9D7J9_9ARCH|nr:hypothetical protein [Candidatus Prometheoarchaeum syntrophicum]
MGKAPKKIHAYYIFSILMFYFIITVISICLYPEPYSLFNHISNLGSKSANPNGYLLWNIGTVILGLLFIPHMIYIHNYFISLSPRLNILNYSLGIISSIGWSLVGVFREDFITAHFITASIAFIGLLITLDLDFVIICNRKSEFANKVHFRVILIHYILLNIIFLISIILPNLDYFFPDISLNSPWLTYPPWEWFYFTILLLLILNLFLFIPKNTEKAITID